MLKFNIQNSIRLLLCLVLFSNLYAQPRHRGARAEHDFEMDIENQIALANYLLLDHHDDLAFEWLAQAKDFKARADQQITQNVPAREYYQKARELAQKATNRLIDLKIQQLENDLQVVQSLQKDDKQNLYEKAVQQLERAQVQRRQGHIRKMIEHLRICRFQIDRIERLAAMNAPGNYLQKEAERYKELKDKSMPVIAECNESGAQKILRQVKTIEEKLDAALADNEEKLALNYYFQASRLLLRAMDLCRGHAASDFESAFEQVELVGEMLALYENQIGRKSQQQNQVLANANKIYEQARFALSRNDYKDAEEKAEQVFELLGSNIKSTNRSENRNRQVRQELYKFNQQIDKALSVNASQSNAYIQAAEFCAAEADWALQKHYMAFALSSILAGKRLLQAENNPTVVRPGELRIGFQAAERVLQSQRWKTVNQDYRVSLEKFSRQAQQAFQRKHYEIAQIYLDFIRNTTSAGKRR